MDFKELTDKIESYMPKAQEIPEGLIDLMFLANGLTGEAGEFANLVKKLARGDPLKKIAKKVLRRKGLDETMVDNPSIDPFNTIILAALQEEVAGVFIYLELISRSLGFDLYTAISDEIDHVNFHRFKK